MIMVIITYGFSSIQIKNPKIDEEEILLQQKILEISNTPKYKIINRNLVVPIDLTKMDKIILLTVDDGPSKRTGEIIKILKNHNAKAIFFINGMHEKNNIGVIEEIYKSGNALGNHTWSHLNLKKEKDINIIDNEIIRNSELINNLTWVPTRFFRAPYGESNFYIRKFVKDNGMIFMDWSGSAIDWDKSTVEKDIFINNALINLHSGSIILIHEHPWSVANLDGLLTTLDEKGYTYIDPKDIIE